MNARNMTFSDAIKSERARCIAIAEAEEKEAAPKGGEVSNLCPDADKEKAYWNGYWAASHNIAHDLREQSNSPT